MAIDWNEFIENTIREIVDNNKRDCEWTTREDFLNNVNEYIEKNKGKDEEYRLEESQKGKLYEVLSMLNKYLLENRHIKEQSTSDQVKVLRELYNYLVASYNIRKKAKFTDSVNAPAVMPSGSPPKLKS